MEKLGGPDGSREARKRYLRARLTDQRGRALSRTETIRNREQHYAEDGPDGGRMGYGFYSAQHRNCPLGREMCTL